MAIAHTLLKIAYQVLKTGTPYTDLGAGFYASRETPQARQDYLIRQLQKLNPAASSPSPQRRLPDGPGLIPDRPPGRRPAPQLTAQTAAGC